MDNVTPILHQDDRLDIAFVELTRVMLDFQERFGLSEVEMQAITTAYNRYQLDYFYYSINGLWEEDDA